MNERIAYQWQYKKPVKNKNVIYHYLNKHPCSLLWFASMSIFLKLSRSWGSFLPQSLTSNRFNLFIITIHPNCIMKLIFLISFEKHMLTHLRILSGTLVPLFYTPVKTKPHNLCLNFNIHYAHKLKMNCLGSACFSLLFYLARTTF